MGVSPNFDLKQSKINLLQTVKSYMFHPYIISIMPINISDNKFIAITSSNGLVAIWQKKYQQPLKLLKYHKIQNGFISHIIYLSKYFTMAVSVENDYIVFLNIYNGKQLKYYFEKNVKNAYNVSVFPIGQTKLGIPIRDCEEIQIINLEKNQ